MKGLLSLLCISILIVSCKSTKDYVTIQGKISDQDNAKKITLKNPKAHFNRTLNLDENGVFKDTFKLKKPTYILLTDGKQKSILYVKNGDKLKLSLNAKEFTSSLNIKGRGIRESKYLAEKASMQKDFFKDSLYYKPEKVFQDKLKKYTDIFKTELHKSKDSSFIVRQDKYIKSFEKYAKKTYDFERFLALNLSKGTPAPDFTYTYKDKEDKEYTLKDLQGKYLYIKFWATWCGYCRKEAPFYKKLAKKYADKNIAFVSISIDNERSYKMWKKMVDKEESNIIELFSKDDKEFKDKYKLNEIPRFMLIDPKGNIINTNTPEPSSPEMTKMIEELI